MVHIGACLFILGSFIFCLASMTNIYRTSHVLSNPENQLLRPSGSPLTAEKLPDTDA